MNEFIVSFFLSFSFFPFPVQIDINKTRRITIKESERGGEKRGETRERERRFFFWKSSVCVFFYLQEKVFKNAKDGKGKK